MAEYFYEYINLKNKKLNGRPVSEWMLYYEPNERLMLWIIYNCKEAFNPRHHLQYCIPKDETNPNEHRLKKHLEMLQTLRGKGFVKQDKNRNYNVTIKGQLFRLTTHPQWIFIQIGVPVFFVILFGVINCNKNRATSDTTPSSTETKKSNNPPSDSVQYNSAQTQTVKDSGSSLIDSGKTKTIQRMINLNGSISFVTGLLWYDRRRHLTLIE
jgi:hypothetical protein